VTNLDRVYESRFDVGLRRRKHAMWAEIVSFLQQWINENEPVLDIACDEGYFIGHVKATERWATDIRDVRSELPDEVHFVQADGLALREAIPAGRFGCVFMSNYLEHLRSSDEVIEQLRVARDLLRPGGRLIVLQPNVRLTGAAYWDFIDHHVPLTERSLTEAAELAGFRTIKLITRFLPFTTKGRLPTDARLVRLYLAFPPAWLLLGRQTLYVGEVPSS
jgi:SAM-dependent methyltransferase